MKTRIVFWLIIATMLPLMGCGMSEDKARRLVDERVAAALAAVPTVTPAPAATPQPTATAQPTATPQPTAIPMTLPATATPQPAPTPQPTATPLPLWVLAQLFPTPTPLVPPPTPKPTPTATSPVVVHPGKLIWMIAGWGNERFTYNFAADAGSNFGRILHGFLVVTNERAELLPGIATKWEISKDGKTWTFTIREGGKFHSGEVLNAADVWWTWMHYLGRDASGSAVERATQSTAQALAQNVENIALTAHNQVSFTWKSPDLGFPAAYASDAGGNWYGVLPRRPKVHDSAQEAAYDRNPIGAGPGKLVKHVPGDLMAFERFDDYYYQPKNGLPEDRRLNFRSLDLRLVYEDAVRVAAVRAGEADIATVILPSRKQIESTGGRLVFGQEGRVFDVRLLGCWKLQYPCYDKRVRQALDYAINKELMRDKLYGHEMFEVKGFGTVTPSTIGYTAFLDPLPFDPAKARQLLADAGYPGGKGFGKLAINTWVSIAMPLLPESAQLAADFWRRELGLDVEVKVGEEAAVKRATLTNQLHGQVLWGDNEARLDGTSTLVTLYGTPGDGARLHETSGLFGLVQTTLAIIDPADRDPAYKKLHLWLRQEGYQVGIGYVNIPWPVGPRVLTWRPYALAVWPSALHTITLK